MRDRIHPSWENIIKNSTEAPYFDALTVFVEEEYKTSSCYPEFDAIFAAFDLCPLDEVKVVLLGQDPYHGPGQAQGLSFSVPEGVKHPPSLVNIFKEIESDLQIPYPTSGNLERWARQGVLLLNATLTVRAHEAGSHQKQGWEIFTDDVIKAISARCNGVVFLLWGGYAKKKQKFIDESNHLILISVHPSPLSANRGHWFGNKHFSQCNEYLETRGQKPIAW
ncbi:MAG: uracil-DNA glycosylase [Flavobacteriaceae bacterium]|jgi:uracil-DNA glycosylase|nr:uracil-DNA glycosylase [Candidatus Arcticimaribacter sp.]